MAPMPSRWQRVGRLRRYAGRLGRLESRRGLRLAAGRDQAARGGGRRWRTRCPCTLGKRSTASMRSNCAPASLSRESTLRCEWREDHVICASKIESRSGRATSGFGQPHGSLVRGAFPRTAAERARFEVPAQRYALCPRRHRRRRRLGGGHDGWNARGLRVAAYASGCRCCARRGGPIASADRGEARNRVCVRADGRCTAVRARSGLDMLCRRAARARCSPRRTPGVIVVADRTRPTTVVA